MNRLGFSQYRRLGNAEKEYYFEDPTEFDEITKLIHQTQQEPPAEVEKEIKDMTEDELKQYVSSLRKKDLQEIIDSALDSGDYATLAKLQPYMKESLEWKIYESEIKRFLK